MELNERYVELLLENAKYQQLQRELKDIELKMSAKEIIFHAEQTFPTVGIKK